MEETNIPDQLTYHDPEPRNKEEQRGKLFIAARIISAVFTPFMVPLSRFYFSFSLPICGFFPCNIN